jgi:hypothetical protein
MHAYLGELGSQVVLGIEPGVDGITHKDEVLQVNRKGSTFHQNKDIIACVLSISTKKHGCSSSFFSFLTVNTP